MDDLIQVLQTRFGESNVRKRQEKLAGDISLIEVRLDEKVPLTLILTSGLSTIKMEVPSSYKGHEFNELYFCLPNYWDLNDVENPQMNWPFSVLEKLTKNIIENKTWYGYGHTITNGNPPQPISKTMQQSYFLLTEPILLKDSLTKVQLNQKEVNFLAVVPIFKKEFEQKQKWGYFRWKQKFIESGGSEELNDFREMFKTKKWYSVFKK